MKTIEKEIAALIVDKLMLSDVTSDTMQVSGSLVEEYGLDSIDFLELAMAISKKYDVKFREENDENTKHFYSVRTIADYVQEKLPEGVKNQMPAKEKNIESPEEIVFNEIVLALHEMFEFPKATLKYETKLMEELELDSLDALDLVVRLQDTLDVRIPDDDLLKLRSIGDVVAVVLRLQVKAS